MKQTILIIGAGLAGLSAALKAAEKQYRVLLISSMPSERAQSVMAEGGINAALDTKGENDSVEEHFKDTMQAGVYLADPNAVRALTKAAPDIVRRLVSLGVVFNRDEHGGIDLRNFGGQKKKRTAFAMSSTGKQIMTALIQEVRRQEAEENIIRYSDHSFVSLIQDDSNRCLGCVVLDNRTQELLPLQGDAVIIASGGMNGLFGKTTGSQQNTGEAAAELFRLGVPIANGEFIQYHPTTAACSGKRLLISEAARGEGGRLFALRNGKPWCFMEEKYPEWGNLMPRDVISREIWRIRSAPDGPASVFLDMTHLPSDVMEQRLGDLVEDCITYLHVDPRREPVPVSPGIHYFMGGLQVDEHHRTAFPRLYAAGECCCQYHGANRLGGNSVLGAIYGGSIAAESAMLDVEDGTAGAGFEEYSERTVEEIRQRRAFLQGRGRNFPIPGIRAELSRILLDSLGIVRNGPQMEAGISAIDRLMMEKVEGNYDPTCGTYENLSMKNLCLLGKALLLSAYNRRESRGAHNRGDFPDRNDTAYQKDSVARYESGGIIVRFKDIPQERGTVCALT
ncbi:FAD-binding protein [Clostridium sp. KNHs216]|uniref:FAD-binding protein n=1 Tax=Clostridium sp. KNHs216 TaxID=1550235 RepID=UPI001154B289|nr:FAD-binding protein [Clostridium sp. KNHs216]TQI66026.1 succinate dehydrogenase / fumarate reductase flavoprotein subunit [Clostridium sp. KNHs216]